MKLQEYWSATKGNNIRQMRNRGTKDGSSMRTETHNETKERINTQKEPITAANTREKREEGL